MRRLLFLFTMAGMLLTTSCSKDELDTASSGNEAQVTFSLGLEGHIATRAISDGTSADKLMYAVFNENGERVTGIKQVTRKNVTFPTTETLVLAKGQTYKVAFWAQSSKCSAYDVDDNMNVMVSYDNATNNDETRDAFFKTVTVEVTGSTSIDVELKRPFAQINVGVEMTDWTAAVASGITIQNSSVVIKNAATSIDLVTGKVNGSTEVTYSLATIPAQLTPAEDLKVDVDGDKEIGTDEIYKWLSMSYILVNDESENGAAKATLEGLKFTFSPNSGNEIILEDGLNSIPVQRNWRTNILGKLLTGDITFNISIDEMYEDDHIYPNGSAQELAMAAANGGEVTLEEDVVLSEPLVIAEGKTVKIDLNGKTISNTNDIWSESEGKWSLISVQGGTLIIENGEIVAKENDCYPIDVQDGGTVIIESGTYVGNCHAVYVYDGKAEIKGGTFSIQQLSTNPDPYGYVINCYDTNYKNGTASVSVTGGTFIGFDPANCKAEGEGTNFVASGYTSIKTSDDPITYEVVEGSDVTDPNNFATAFSSGSGVVTVSEDLAINGGRISGVESAVLQLKSGATLSQTKSSDQCIQASSGCKNLTINGDGTIEAPTTGTGQYSAAIWTQCPNLVIEGDVTFDGSTGNKNTNIAVYIANGTTTINGGHFIGGIGADGSASSCIYLHPARSNYKPVLNIYGGVFETESDLNGWYPVINIYDSYRDNCTVLIYGGIFVNYDPATGDNTGAEDDTFVAPGYKSVEITYEGKKAWQVVKDE